MIKIKPSKDDKATFAYALAVAGYSEGVLASLYDVRADIQNLANQSDSMALGSALGALIRATGHLHEVALETAMHVQAKALAE